MNNKVVNKLSLLPFVITGLVFLIAGILLYVNQQSFYNNSIKTEANIISINKDSDECKIVIEFKADGKSFKGELTNCNLVSESDKTISIFYNKTNPSNFKTYKNYTISIIFISVGTIITILSTISLIKNNIKYDKYLNSKLTGERVEAKIIGVETDTSIIKDGKCPYYVVCSLTNPFNRKEEVYKSDNVWYEVGKLIETNNIKMIPVYIDENNYENYYVDTSIFEILNK